MNVVDLLVDAYSRIDGSVHHALDGISDDLLTARIDPEANTIAWLVWHLTRIQDDHIAGVADTEQVWIRDGWADRFGLPFDKEAHGYGMSAEEVGQVKASAELLRGYYDAVAGATREFLAGLNEADLDRVIDENWDPPVTLGVRILSVLSDDLQHAGQAAYARGVLERQA